LIKALYAKHPEVEVARKIIGKIVDSGKKEKKKTTFDLIKHRTQEFKLSKK